LTQVHPTLRLRLSALALVGVSILLSIIYLISTTALNAIISLQAMAPERFVHSPNPLPGAAPDSQRPTTTWAIQLWPLRPCHQSLRPSLFGLHYHLDVIPTSATRHEGQHEPCGPASGRGDCWCADRLGNWRIQEIQGAYRAHHVTLLWLTGYFARSILVRKWMTRWFPWSALVYASRASTIQLDIIVTR
jgi:hypothetical protein